MLHQKFFAITQTEREAEIQPDSVADDAQVGNGSLYNWEQWCSLRMKLF